MTLLADLERCAKMAEASALTCGAHCQGLAARLRAHAAWLREEMAKAVDYFDGGSAEKSLTRINGGPLDSPTEEPPR